MDLDHLARRLGEIEGVVAVALGGSRARGTHGPDSDYDLGLYYREDRRFSVDALVALAGDLNDTPDPIVTDFGRWGRWVNGGAWLTIRGERLDFLYRSLDALHRVLDDCQRGHIELDYIQQPPLGFWNHAYLGELSIAQPLYDPNGVLPAIQRHLSPYPPALRRTIIRRMLWGAEFDLPQARAFAARGDAYNAVACLARVAAWLVQAAYALNERYFVHDKGALEEIAGFASRPPRFEERVRAALAPNRGQPEGLVVRVEALAALHEELVALCGDLYERPRFHSS